MEKGNYCVVNSCCVPNTLLDPLNVLTCKLTTALPDDGDSLSVLNVRMPGLQGILILFFYGGT